MILFASLEMIPEALLCFALLFTAMLLCCACLLMCLVCDINSELLKFGISIVCDAEFICQLKSGFNMIFAGQVEL